MKPPSQASKSSWSALRVLAIILAGLFLLAVAAVALGYRWFNANKGRLREAGIKITAEAKAFGQDKPPSVCVNEGVARLKHANGLIEEVYAKIFMRECLRVADVPAEFCAGVPSKSEILASATWALSRCEKLGMPGDQPCARLVQAIQEHCSAEP